MQYHVTVTLEPPVAGVELDSLQREGAGSLISSAVGSIDGAKDEGGNRIDLLQHWTGVYPTGAIVLLIVSAPRLEAAEEAAAAMVTAALERTGLLADWRILSSEVGFNESFVRAGLAAAEGPDGPPSDLAERARWNQSVSGDEAGSGVSRPEDIDWPAWVRRHADRLTAFDLTAFDSATEGEAHARLLAGALIFASASAIDELFSDLDEFEGDTVADGGAFLLADWLPQRFAAHYTRQFLRRFIVAMVAVTGRLAYEKWRPPASTAEALALHLLIQQAQVLIDAHELLSGRDMNSLYRTFQSRAFTSLDHERLYEPAVDGWEDDDAPAPLDAQVEDWFLEAPDAVGTVHPSQAEIEPPSR